MHPVYLVITPVRNEAGRIERTIESMLSQSVRPVRWIIVDDGSTDGTYETIAAAEGQHPWIRVCRRADRGARKPGRGVVEAFYEGFELAQDTAWDFLVKLDGDLAFAPDYFKQCLARFAADGRLGIGGGRVGSLVDDCWVDDSPNDPPFHVRGATKIYRRAAWSAIGGLICATGWDTLDEVKANMLGWATYSFQDIRMTQLKPTGNADGAWRNWFKNGRANYIAGYHPIFMLCKCAKRAFQRPLILGAVGLLSGYVTGYLGASAQVGDRELIQYLRSQQWRRLTGRSSLWDSRPARSPSGHPIVTR